MAFEEDGLHALPAGKLASVVTYLEMTERPAPRDLPPRSDLSLRRVHRPELAWYRRLYHAVGADWLWFSRLELEEAALAGIIGDPAVELYALEHEGADKGLLELDRRRPPDIELAFFGLMPELIGGGAGRWLMTQAIDRAFAYRPRRFWVHTCTLDHPAALDFYRRSGFRPYRRAIEVVEDPRLRGVLDRDAAGQVPLIE